MKLISLSEYLKIAADLGLHRKRSWRINMLLRLLDYKDVPNNYLYPDTDKYVFNNGEEIIGVAGLDITKSPVIWRTKIKVLKGTTKQIKEDINTIFGNYINNTVIFADVFGDRVPYHNGHLTMGEFHKAYFKLYQAKNLTAKELQRSCSALEVLSADSEFGVPAASVTTFTTHKDMDKRKKELLAKYGDKKDDPLVQAKIDKELTGLDREHVRGTAAQDFIISGKQHDVVRKKTMIMYGSETDMDGKPTPLVDKPLEEGLDMDRMPSWVDAARAGSFGRGGMTALGGADVKQDYLAYGDLLIRLGDCKTKEGLDVLVKPGEYKRLAGMRLLKDNTPLDENKLKGLIGKVVTIRVPGKCKSPVGGYCQMCMGIVGAKVLTAIPTEVSVVDSNSMDAMMQAAHGKARVAVKIDLKYYAS